jgi:hypothetical protein
LEIRKVTYDEVEAVFALIKPDLLDICATYFGCFIQEELVGIVSYVEQPYVIYLCHAYVKDEYRNRGVYKMLWNYRDIQVKDSKKQVYAHCNVDSLKYFINNGYQIEKALFKVVKNK